MWLLLTSATLVFGTAIQFKKLHEVHTAEGAIQCGMQYADIDKDGRLSHREVEVIRDLALGKVLAAGVWLASKLPLLRDAVSVEQIFDDCDHDSDGFITLDDFEHSRATCLETPGKVSDAYKWVCDQGRAGVFDHAKLGANEKKNFLSERIHSLCRFDGTVFFGKATLFGV